jgi:hypothetical protein
MDILVKRPASIRWGDHKSSSGRMRGTGFPGVDARSDTGYLVEVVVWFQISEVGSRFVLDTYFGDAHQRSRHRWEHRAISAAERNLAEIREKFLRQRLASLDTERTELLGELRERKVAERARKKASTRGAARAEFPAASQDCAHANIAPVEPAKKAR